MNNIYESIMRGLQEAVDDAAGKQSSDRRISVYQAGIVNKNVIGFMIRT